MHDQNEHKVSKNLVLILGGSGGIGKQIAKDCLRNSWRVLICSNKPDQLASALAELQLISSDCAAIECDVAETDSVNAMTQRVLTEEGCPDILINCAGYATYRTFEESDWSEIENLIQVNFVGAVRFVKGFLPSMIARRSGVIVNMSSIAGRMPLTPNGTYSTCKHAMVTWSELLKYEVSRFGIKVNVICPGRVETSFFDHETFKTRLPRAETQYQITVEQVSKATLQAVKRDRFLTYVPWTFGPMVWAMNTFPWFVKPIYNYLIQSRLNSYYQASPIENRNIKENLI
jgi:short-subunit dehydrogenase